MTQQDLIKLIGLKSTDAELLAHFELYGLAKPPKNLTSNNGGKIIHDKERNIYYSFNFEVYNDNFYPPVDVGIKNRDYKFQAYLSEISFLYKEPSTKKPDPKEVLFWNLTPAPTASLKEVEGCNSASLKNEAGIGVNFNFIKVHLRLAGKLETYLKFHSGQEEERKEMLRSITFNETNYATFYNEMNSWFVYFKTLTEANTNN